MDLKKLLKEYNIPWITEKGYVDFSKYPIEQPAKDALSRDEEKFRNANREPAPLVKTDREKPFTD